MVQVFPQGIMITTASLIYTSQILAQIFYTKTMVMALLLTLPKSPKLVNPDGVQVPHLEITTMTEIWIYM